MNFVFRLNGNSEEVIRKRSRSCKPKVKTGCKTCKQRRVKCDETKPSCNKCLQFGTICGGYLSQSDILSSPRVKGVSRSLQELPLLTLEYFPEAASFENENEFQYFRHFREHGVFELTESLGYEATLWTDIIFPASDYNSALRGLVISVGALSQAREDSGSFHYQFAVQQYGKALRKIQVYIASCEESASEPTRVALIAGLLIFCFEGQQGDPTKAIRHMRSALGVLQRRLSHTRKTFSHIRDVSPIPDVEFELITTLVRMDQWLTGKVETNQVKAVQEKVLRVPYVSEERLPYTKSIAFSTIREARNHFEDLVYRFLYNYEDDDWRISRQSRPRFFRESPRKSLPLYSSLVAEIETWTQALGPLLRRFSQPRCLDFTRVGVLYVQSVCLRLIIRSAESPENESKAMDLLSLSQEIVAWSRRLAKDERFHRKFTLETGIIHSLYTVVIECQERSVREEATDVLRSMIPRRENVWDSVECVRACEDLLDEGGVEFESCGSARS